MAIGSALAVYFIIWWTLLFAVLPIGLKTQAEAGEVVPGSVASAPAKPRFVFIVIVNSIVSGVAGWPMI